MTPMEKRDAPCLKQILLKDNNSKIKIKILTHRFHRKFLKRSKNKSLKEKLRLLSLAQEELFLLVADSHKNLKNKARDKFRYRNQHWTK